MSPRGARAVACSVLCAAGFVGLAQAQAASAAAAPRSISLSGSMGDRALLIIDGVPRTLAQGASYQGIKLITLVNGDAQIEVDGKRAMLHLGVPVNLSGATRSGAGTQIILTAGSGGHFMTAGSINGKTVDFLVDTGATSVSMSQADADRLGLDYRKGRRSLMQTANGNVPVNAVKLDRLRIGDVEVYDVDAIVMPAQMNFILLGNSFLTRFQMRRENDRMTLDKRL